MSLILKQRRNDQFTGARSRGGFSKGAPVRDLESVHGSFLSLLYYTIERKMCQVETFLPHSTHW